jgi:hypothetical protein
MGGVPLLVLGRLVGARLAVARSAVLAALPVVPCRQRAENSNEQGQKPGRGKGPNKVWSRSGGVLLLHLRASRGCLPWLRRLVRT